MDRSSSALLDESSESTVSSWQQAYDGEMVETEEVGGLDLYDERYYKELAKNLFPEEKESKASEEHKVEEESEQESGSTDSLYQCRCAWYAAQEPVPVEEDIESPSEVLFDTLTRQDFVAHAGDEDADSRFAPDSLDEDGAIEESIVPFSCYWSLGFTANSLLINLSNETRREFYISNAHKGVICDYKDSETLRFVHGHVKPVMSASIDATGVWLVTGGIGLGSKLVVTNTVVAQQLLIIDNPDQDYGSLLLSMAPNAKFFVSVHGLENQVIKFWNWTRGSATPDYIYEIGDNLGTPHGISYHPNDQSFMMFSFEKHVFFAHWNQGEYKLENFVYPVFPKRIAPFGDCSMLADQHEAYAVSANGNVTVFGNVLHMEQFSEHPIDTNKIYVKSIKVTRHPIKSMCTVEKIIAILDQRGAIRFFNKDVRLLYWLERNIAPMDAMSFRTMATSAMRENVLHFQKLYFGPNEVDPASEVYSEEDRSEEYDSMADSEPTPKASLMAGPFECPDLIAGGKDGRFYLIDIPRRVVKPFFFLADSAIAAVCVANTMPFLCVAYAGGRITKFNYEALNAAVTSTALMPKTRFGVPESTAANSCISISSGDIHIVVGQTSGAIIFLDSTMKPLPNARYTHTSASIERMLFSDNNLFLAFYNAERTMFVMQSVEAEWALRMKFRGHTAPITDALFINYSPPRLFSIGEDRFMVEYFVQENKDALKSRVRIEQTATPLCFIHYPDPAKGVPFFLVANSEHKFKLFEMDTQACRAVFLGPSIGYSNAPVNRMAVVPNTAGKYVVFSNNTHMGILKIPVDGNPFKYAGILANPNCLSFTLCNKGKYVFTHATNGDGILIWTINIRAVDILHYLGGAELEPFFGLIEGGAKGWLFKEIEDLFCYVQILHQRNAYAPQQCSHSIFISDLPDLVRACGFYPSEFEAKLLVDDITYRDYYQTGAKREMITFVEFVKLLINHRPAYGVKSDEIRKHFNVLLDGKEALSAEAFAHIMCNYGVPFTKDGLNHCLRNLMSDEKMPAFADDVLATLRPITLEYFTESILGIIQGTAYANAQQRAICLSDEEKQEAIEKQ